MLYNVKDEEAIEAENENCSGEDYVPRKSTWEIPKQIHISHIFQEAT